SRGDARRLAEGETDAEGHARFDALPRGPLVAVVRPTFDVQAAVRIDVPAEATTVDARAAASEDDGDEGSTVEAEVLDRAGAAVANVNAVLIGERTGYSP